MSDLGVSRNHVAPAERPQGSSHRPGLPVPALTVERRSLVVLAGLPGAGKTTALARMQTDPDARVLDSEQVRGWLKRKLPTWWRYRWYRMVVHVAHRARIAWACLTSRGPVIAHEPATRASTRAMLLTFAWLTSRQVVLLWLRADAAAALQGQLDRGRLIRSRSFARHVRRARKLERRLGRGISVQPRLFGWDGVTVVDRSEIDDGLSVRTGPMPASPQGSR